MASMVGCSAPVHALTDAQRAHLDVLLLVNAATDIEVPRNAASGSVWLVDVATDGAVAVSVAGDAGSINGRPGGSAAAAGAGSVLTVWVQANPGGNAPAVRVVGDTAGAVRLAGDLDGNQRVIANHLVAELDRDGDHTFVAADAGAETLFDGAADVAYTVPAGLPRGWRHTVWNRSVAATARVRGAAGVRVNGADRGAVPLGPGALARIACHGSDTISVATLALAATSGGVAPVAGEPGDVDPAHPINRGLVLMIGSHRAGSGLLGIELVTRAALSRIGTRVVHTGNSVFAGFKCAHLPAGSGTRDGLCLADATALAKLRTALQGKTAWSVHLRFFISAAPPEFGHILAWPFEAAVGAFVWEPLQRNERANDSWRHLFMRGTPPPDFQISPSPAFAAGAWAGEWSLGIARNGDALQWYRDGAPWGSPATGLGAATMRFPATLRPLCLMNWSEADPFAHSWEWRLSQVRIWNRALSAQEMADAHGNVGVVA